MSVARSVIIFVVTISVLTFVAFFGRLPALRKTPIGFLHRLLIVHLPSAFRKVDVILTNGRLTNGGSRLGHYLMYEKHPLVVIFFLGVLTASVVLFVPVIWEFLPIHHRSLIPLIVPLPYVFTYLSARRNKETFISGLNHLAQMRHYPYDRILYYPGNACTTCKFLKPARSKHCSICKACVAKMDHHCVWVNNCLGRGNYRWFLALLLSTTATLAYGAYLAYVVITPLAMKQYAMYESWYKYNPHRPLDSSSWITYFDMKTHYFLTYASIYLEVGGLRASGVGLLAFLTWPLSLGLLCYHIYLIYAGMTTNESSKWADWRDDMADGVVFLGLRREDTMQPDHFIPSNHDQQLQASPSPSLSTSPETLNQEEEPPTSWPLESRHILIRTLNGQPPQNLPSRIRSVAKADSFERVHSLSAVENVYDLGFWDNFMEALK